MTESEEEFDPASIGSTGPPIDAKPYKILFDANRCIGAGKCAEVSANWELDISTGIAAPRSFFVDDDGLAENIAAADRCPAKKGAGVIHVIDRRTGKELAPDPHGDGTVSIDW